MQAKVLVFVSTCRQAQFLGEALRRLRPGAPLRCLHGKMKQAKRMSIFYDFCQVCGLGGGCFIGHSRCESELAMSRAPV